MCPITELRSAWSGGSAGPELDEGAVARSEERLRLAVETTGIGIWDVDARTWERRWTPEFRAILGIDENQTADPDFFTGLIHPEDRDQVVARYAELYAPDTGDSYEIECRLRRADTGEYRWVLLQGRVFRDPQGAVVRGIGTITDITARREADRTLRFQALLLERMTEGVSLSTAEGVIVYTNAAEDQLFGYAPGEMLGLHVSAQNAYSPEENERIVGEVIEALKTRGAWEGEWLNRRKDGTTFLTASRITAVEIDGAMHFLCVQRDVTAEREARERERLLSREVDHRARNALAVVQSLIRLTPFVTREQFVETLGGRINAMARVHTLLSRNAWKGASLKEIICAELAPFDTEGRISIRGPDVNLRLEAAQSLSLFVHELTTNAGKYGGLASEAGRLEVRWTIGGDGGLRLEWKETTPVPVTPPERVGFGTKLINGAASQVAGELTRSWEPDGLRCTLQIGRGQVTADAPPEPPASVARPLVRSLRGARVLLVEDETLLAMETLEHLQAAGATVVGPANTLEQALSLAGSETFDCAVLDVNLGGRTVEPLAFLLRRRGVPFVLVTGYETPDIEAPVVLSKPVDHAELMAALSGQLFAAG